MKKYGTPQVTKVKKGICKISSKEAEDCCAEIFEKLRKKGAGTETCSCGNKILVESL